MVLSVNFCAGVKHSATVPSGIRSLLRREDPLGGAGAKADPAIRPEQSGVLPPPAAPGPAPQLPPVASSVGAVVPEPTALPEALLAPTGTTGPPPAALAAAVPPSPGESPTPQAAAASLTLPPPALAIGVLPSSASPPQSTLPPQPQPPASDSPPRPQQQVAAEAATQQNGVAVPTPPAAASAIPPQEPAAVSQQTPVAGEDDVKHRLTKRGLRLVVFGLTLVCVLLVWEQSRMMWGINCCCEKNPPMPQCGNNAKHGETPLVRHDIPLKEMQCSSCTRTIVDQELYHQCKECEYNLCEACGRNKGFYHDLCTCRVCIKQPQEPRHSVGGGATPQQPQQNEDEESGGEENTEEPEKDGKEKKDPTAGSSADATTAAGDAAGGG